MPFMQQKGEGWMQNKLLLADDSLTIQKVVELVLVHEHFEIKAVNDGEQALQAIETFAPDIILADIEMPKLNGYQLCEKIKSNMATAHIPVILLAGAFEPFDEEYAKAVGADDFIIKPFESQELISKVKSLLISSVPPQQATAEPTIEEVVHEEEPMAVSGSAAAVAAAQPAPQAQEEEINWDAALKEQQTVTAAADEPADEEYESKVALSETAKDFAEELSMAMEEKEETAAPYPVQPEQGAATIALPSSEDILEVVKQSVDEKIADVINSEVAPSLSAAIQESVARTLSEIAPGIIERVTRELVNEHFDSLHRDINAAIGKIVPEVAETLIQREIEKITAEL